MMSKALDSYMAIRSRRTVQSSSLLHSAFPDDSSDFHESFYVVARLEEGEFSG